MSTASEDSSLVPPMARVTARAVALFAVLSLAATSAAANCPTFLPDLSGSCDRQARPAGGISPMSMPYLFEDPYITTGVQFVGIWHGFPQSSVFKGGQAGVIAVQARLAITDRIAFIATKDGFTMFRPELQIGHIDPAVRVALGIPETTTSNALLADQNDIMDITAGFKMAVVDMKSENQSLIITPSIRYEVPLGAHDLFQGQGSGVFIPSASAGWNIGSFHSIVGFGAQIPFDNDKDSTSIFYNLHLDYAIECGSGSHLVPFVEVSGMRWTKGGDGSALVNTTVGRLPLSAVQAVLGTGAFEGADIANLGSTGIAGTDLVTMAWGARYLLSSKISLGASYERAISSHKGIFGERVTVMANYEF